MNNEKLNPGWRENWFDGFGETVEAIEPFNEKIPLIPVAQFGYHL